MKTNDVFIGDVRKCIVYQYQNDAFFDHGILGCDCFGHIVIDDVLYKKDAILVKYKDYGYIDVEEYKRLFDYIKIRKSITKNGWKLGGVMMPEYAYKEDGLFVDASSLRPFYSDSEEKEISMKTIKKHAKEQKTRD